MIKVDISSTLVPMDKEAVSLARDYSNYLKADVKQDAKNVEDAIEDTLTRLDEFTGLIDMLQCETSVKAAQRILNRKTELVGIFENVRNLENLVSHVKQHLDVMEEAVVKAETQLNFTTEGKIKNFLRPLFGKKRGTSSSTEESTQLPAFIPPPVFTTKDFFPTQTST